MHENKFITWVQSVQPNALEFNPGSTQQMQQLLFGPCFRKMSDENARKIKLRRAGGNDESSEEQTPEDEISPEENSGETNKSNMKLVEVIPAERTFRVENKMV